MRKQDFKLKIMRNLSLRLRLLADPQGKPLQESTGQALLIILLIMAVALTIGLSVVSRSITDIRISQQTEEAARAYSAAEAGIEESLYSGTGGSAVLETGASYQTAVSGVAEGASEFVFPQEVSTNEIATLFLAQHDASGNLVESAYYTAQTLDVCWEGNTALETTVYYKTAVGAYQAARGAWDPNPGRRSTNSFAEPDGGSCLGLSNKKTLNFVTMGAQPTLLFLRFRLFYGNAKVGVKTPGGSGGVLPSQGNKIESLGEAGEAKRKVAVVRFHPAPPEIFDFALYSGGTLVK